MKNILKIGKALTSKSVASLTKIGALTGKIALRHQSGRKLFNEPERAEPPRQRKPRIKD